RGLVEQELGGVVAGRGGRVDAFGGGTHEEEHRRHFTSVVREVLRAHLQRWLDDVLRAGGGAQAGQHARGQFRVVDGHRVALADRDPGGHAGTVRGGDVAGDVVQVGVDLRPHAFVEGADGPDQLDRVGDDVVADAAVDLAEADHRRLVGDVAAAADHGLRTADQV